MKKSIFGSITLLSSFTFVLPGVVIAAGQHMEQVIYKDKYVGQYFEIDESGNTKLHIFLGDQKISTIENQEEIYFNIDDHLDSTTIITNKMGQIVEINDYEDFGAIINQESVISNNYKFGGKELDNEMGLQYFGARYYDDSIARFVSVDPLLISSPNMFLMDPQQLNSYSYARNNPIRFIDPTGLSTATFNPVPEGGWQLGDDMGQFNDVTARYNGIGSGRTKNSCIEYAKRYMSEVYGINNIGAVGDPKTMWGMLGAINNNLEKASSPYKFIQYNNGGGFNLPKEGDLLIWTQGTWGHIMVVTESSFDNNSNSGYVEIIDQNASKQAVRQYEVMKTNSGYSIMKNSDTAMTGWFSPVNKNYGTMVTTGHNPSPPAPNKQPGFFQRTWNKTKSFFRNLF